MSSPAFPNGVVTDDALSPDLEQAWPWLLRDIGDYRLMDANDHETLVWQPGEWAAELEARHLEATTKIISGITKLELAELQTLAAIVQCLVKGVRAGANGGVAS
jgi:hypothetical protein